MKRLALLVLSLSPLVGCASPAIKPEKPSHVKYGVAYAKNDLTAEAPFELALALRRLAESATTHPVTVELHVRGRAARVSISTTAPTSELPQISLPILNVLSMYFDDYAVVANNMRFTYEGLGPQDGEV